MMKRFLIPATMAIIVVSAVVGCASTRDRPQYGSYERPLRDVDESYFYDALAPYGDWVHSDNYGVVWCPVNEPVDWRPYTQGEWVWTDYGWTWASDEDWGWATYHYGRWYDDRYNGWCWVPGRDWGPAWVAWREGGGYVGWAPLPPEVTWQDNVGFNWNSWDAMPGVQHYWWSFARERDLPGPGVNRRLVPRHRGGVLVRETHNITNYVYVDAHVANRSLGIEPIRRVHGKNIPTRVVHDLSAPPVNHGRQISDGRFAAFRPELRELPAQAAPDHVRPIRRDPADARQAPRVTQQAQVRMDNEDRALRDREDAERRRLEADQQRETRKPPMGVDPGKLRQQHQEEQKALDNQSARDHRVLRSRQDLKREEPAAPPRKYQRPPKAGKADKADRNDNSWK